MNSLRLVANTRYPALAGSGPGNSTNESSAGPDKRVGGGHRRFCCVLTEGIYARIRHPRYVEVVVGVLGYALFANHVGTYVLWLVLLPTLLLVVRLEEAELGQRLGAAWNEYARRVPRFVPRRRSAPLTPSRPISP